MSKNEANVGQTKGPEKQAAGQQKVHQATRLNPDTGATETKDFTQEAWRGRDKSEGWTRPDGIEDEADAPVTPPAPSGSGTGS